MKKERKAPPGAPTKEDEIKINRPIHFTVTKADKEEIERIMKISGLSQSVLMRIALKKLFQDYSTTSHS